VLLRALRGLLFFLDNPHDYLPQTAMPHATQKVSQADISREFSHSFLIL